MKKTIFAAVLAICLAACGSGDDNNSAKSTGSGSAGTSNGAETVDTTHSPNQSGSTGNGGVGTGASNQTGESSAPSGTGSSTGGSGTKP